MENGIEDLVGKRVKISIDMYFDEFGAPQGSYLIDGSRVPMVFVLFFLACSDEKFWRVLITFSELMEKGDATSAMKDLVKGSNH